MSITEGHMSGAKILIVDDESIMRESYDEIVHYYNIIVFVKPKFKYSVKKLNFIHAF